MKKFIVIIFFSLILSFPLLALRSGGMSGGRSFSSRGSYSSRGGGLGGGYSTSGRSQGGASVMYYGNAGQSKNSKYDILVIVGIILMIIISIVIFYVTKKKKVKKSNEIIEKISEIDETWNPEFIKERVKEIFFKLIEAKLTRTYDIKDLVSNSFYLNFKAQIDGMIQRNEKYIIENINIKEIQIVEVTDYEDDSKDRFWVYIVVNMVYLLVNDDKNLIIEGEQKPEDYKELWNFMRGKDNSWILREILDDPEEHMHKFKSFSQEIK